MTLAEKHRCVEIGLKNLVSEQERARQLYGQNSIEMTEAQQIAYLQDGLLKSSPNDWRLKVFGLIRKIPSGHLIAYGDLAKWANTEYDLALGPRNIAWLRKKIYRAIGHDTSIPIHRIAKMGDLTSVFDEPITQEFNKYKRGSEGTLLKGNWIRK